jgi:hypothetical protein
MIVLLYTLIVAYLTYYYRYDLIYYLLDKINFLKMVYITFLKRYHEYFGCSINYIAIHDNVTFINYDFCNKSFILYLLNCDINPYLFFNKLKPGVPYDINIPNNTINTDDNIVYAWTNIDNDEVDVTNFCRMISGPKGNFYNDLSGIVKPTAKIYKIALLEYIKNNSDINIDIIKDRDLIIEYITTSGDEYILE